MPNDNEQGTRVEVAPRCRVALGMVKKLLQQRRRTGDLGPRPPLAGRKPMIVAAHRGPIRSLLDKRNELTWKALRQAVGRQCSLQALPVVLGKMGRTYKKRFFTEFRGKPDGS